MASWKSVEDSWRLSVEVFRGTLRRQAAEINRVGVMEERVFERDATTVVEEVKKDATGGWCVI